MAFIDALLSLFFISFLGVLALGPLGFPAFLKFCQIRRLSRGWALLAALPGPGTLLFLHILSRNTLQRLPADDRSKASQPGTVEKA